MIWIALGALALAYAIALAGHHVFVRETGPSPDEVNRIEAELFAVRSEVPADCHDALAAGGYPVNEPNPDEYVGLAAMAETRNPAAVLVPLAVGAPAADDHLATPRPR